MAIINKVLNYFNLIKWQKSAKNLFTIILMQWAHYAKWLWSLWPSTCDLCLQSAHQHSLLCDVCANDLPLFNYPAGQDNLLQHPQAYALLAPVKFEQLLCLAPYQWPFNQWISQLKYQGRFEVANLLADLLINQIIRLNIKHKLPSLVIPVPMHSWRLKQRHYNQAALIGYALSKGLGCRYAENILSRQHHGKQQVGQTGGQRRNNLRNAFCLNLRQTLPEHIGLIDDVVTTGATVNELSKLLKQHGVKKVTVISVCLTLPKSKVRAI